MTDSLKKILNSTNSKEIEELAKSLSLEEVQTLLRYIEKGKFQEGTLPFIQGLPAELFAIFSNAPFILNLAKTALVQEKVQALIEYFNTIFSQYKEEASVLDECINELPLYPIPSNIFNSLCEQIVQLSNKTDMILQLLDQILRLTWLSENRELVASFSQIKIHFLHLKQQEAKQPTQLMSRINSIFGSDDKASSIDGLPALGINYVEDLKQLSSLLGNDLADLPEKSLLPAIHDRLNASGLATIGDLRDHQIYTKEHLFTYLNKTD